MRSHLCRDTFAGGLVARHLKNFAHASMIPPTGLIKAVLSHSSRSAPSQCLQCEVHACTTWRMEMNLGGERLLRAGRASIAAEVRAELARGGRSAADLTRATSRSQAYWSRRLTGKVAMDTDDLDEVAKIVGIGADELLRRARDRSAAPTPGSPS